MTDLSTITNSNVAKVDAQLVKEMREIAHGRWSEKTKKAYHSAFKDFALFCRDNELEFLPAKPEAVLLYLTFLARHAKWNTIKQRIAAIQAVHSVKKCPSPINDDVKEYLQGVKRKVGEKVEQKKPLLIDDIKTILALTDGSLKGLRDRALILFAFVTWLRAENLCELQVQDISFLKSGIEIKVRKEKQDQTRKGREISVEFGQNPDTCPVFALKAWLAAAGIESGNVFRSVDRYGNINGSIGYTGILKILKQYALQAGFNPEKIGCHSLRSGGVTQADKNGMPFNEGMDYGGWKSATVYRSYIRNNRKPNATRYLGV
jgi:integrase